MPKWKKTYSYPDGTLYHLENLTEQQRGMVLEGLRAFLAILPEGNMYRPEVKDLLDKIGRT